MTLPVFRPLMISATFVLCSTFAGNCRAETDLPCPALCQPSEVLEKNVQFSCFRPGEPLPFNQLVNITVPVACEIILPVNISPDTTP